MILNLGNIKFELANLNLQFLETLKKIWGI